MKVFSFARLFRIRPDRSVPGKWKGRSIILPTGRRCGTLQSYVRLRDYFGEKQVIPLYIQVDDGLRLERALKRERKPGNRRYEEMCRRFLADQADFSEENLRGAGIGRRFQNDEDRSICIAEIAAYIRSYQAEG